MTIDITSTICIVYKLVPFQLEDQIKWNDIENFSFTQNDTDIIPFNNDKSMMVYYLPNSNLKYYEAELKRAEEEYEKLVLG